ncbi:hypothetical protein [Pseudomonas sp. MYb118]|uniref:hypothetical protein n=1 Tax=Pseudomonas sp. MYb118 TaxID=1848720 RepID=UPI0034CE7B4B
MSLERMNSLAAQGFERGMDAVDGGRSVRRMMERTRCNPARRTVAQPATLLVWNRYFSFPLRGLFLPGFHEKPLKARFDGV